MDISFLLELKINQLNEKLASAKKDFFSEANRNLTLKNTLKKIKIDLHNMTANFQDPTQLKLSVKVFQQTLYVKSLFLSERIIN